MNLSNFLLIDAGLAIAVIPFLYLLNNKNKKAYFFYGSNKDELLKKTSINLPDKEKLLGLEKIAWSKGSAIQFDSLIGDWKFVSIRGKDTNNEDSIFSSLLRVFSAKLKLKKNFSTQNSNFFSISTSIEFGLFSLKFSGSGYLEGKQPLLPFCFNLIEFSSGSKVLLSSSIKEPEVKGKTYFALIAADESEGWLSARGQGGSLILWVKA
tara:strand:- start:4990 stop:5616 length:627 start_codon:yes stop_codon:yes gene_type:complete